MKKKTSTQAGDRKKVLEALRVEQRYLDLDAAAQSAEKKSDEIFSRMVEGRDLNSLLGLKKIFLELKSVYKGSDAFTRTLGPLQDRIDDFATGRMKEVKS